MFNNKALLKSKISYSTLIELDSAYYVQYDGTRLIISSLFDNTSVVNFANYISTVDSSYTVYKHLSSSKYGHIYLVLLGTPYTQAIRDAANTDSGYSVHRWNNSYTWQDIDDISSASFGEGLIKSTSYIWAIRCASAGSFDINSYTPGTVIKTTTTFTGAWALARVNGGLSCYANSKLYFSYKPTGLYYKPAYVVISGANVNTLTTFTITELPNEDWSILGVVGGKALFCTNSGHIVIVDCIANTYTYLGERCLNAYYIGSVIGDKIYIGAGIGNYYYIYDSNDDSFTECAKETNMYIFSFCEGFDSNIYWVGRHAITNKHYLGILN